MNERMKNWDAVLATVGFSGTVAFLNSVIGTAIGVLTVGILLFRLISEIKKSKGPMLPCDTCPFIKNEK